MSELHEVDLSRKEDRVRFTEPVGSTLVSPGWIARDDSIVVLRGDTEMRRSDVLLVTATGERQVGQLREVSRGGLALDPVRRILYLTRPRGPSDSLFAFSIDTGRERTVFPGEPTGSVISGIRVLADGRLLFSAQSQNYDILSSQFVR
jgi:hypothetical protein